VNKTVLILVTLLACSTASQAELGRLFYTPQQRQGLENARVQNRSVAGPASATTTQPLTYDGIVLRSDGRSTRWINGKQQSGNSYALTTQGKTLKPGQTVVGGSVYEPHGIRPEEDRQP
jgi:hypothetical protein